jgi:orotidine-5'-phosphate decarboxylase
MMRRNHCHFVLLGIFLWESSPGVFPGGIPLADFIDLLDQACQGAESLVCVGLDADPERMPVPGVADFNRAIIDATADLVCAYKPNLAFYEALGIPGLIALEETIAHIRDRAPQAIIIGDAKRGDIGTSGAAYAKAMFQVWGFDAATVNPWGGRDTVEPFLKDSGKGVFLWCRGSNPGSSDLQDLDVVGPEGTVALYQHLATTAAHWTDSGNLGLVLGATFPEQLRAVRRSCPNVPFLIPGVGAQGGDLEAAVRDGVDANGRRAIINSSRGIIYASTGSDFAGAARRETARLKDAINQILESGGHGWH